MAEPAFKPDLRSAQPAKPEAARPQFESVQGGRPARTEADQAARGKRYEQATPAEAPTQMANTGSNEAATDDLLNNAIDQTFNAPETATEVTTELALETATVASEGPTVRNSEIVTTQTTVPDRDGSTDLKIEDTSARAGAPEAVPTVPTSNTDYQELKRQMAITNGQDSFFTTQDEGPVRTAEAVAPKTSEVATVETPVTETTQAKPTVERTDASDAWFKQKVTAETLRTTGLLPEKFANLESKAQLAEIRLTAALSRGFESVRQRVTAFFTDSEGKERKGRLKTIGVSLAALGTIAMLGLNAYATEDFAKNVKDHLDTMQKYAEQNK